LILPGVGAFRDAIAELERRHLVPLVRDWTQSGKPFLGICLGLQLLFDTSYEGGEYRGLGIIPGEVVRFPFSTSLNHLKVPHMGWNRVHSTRTDDPLLAGIPDSPYFYFVHSYFAAPKHAEDVWLESDYGQPFCAAIRRNNVYATQFHPEKSQSNGLSLLQNFLQLS
jgi:glutamine amidotransferase